MINGPGFATYLEQIEVIVAKAQERELETSEVVRAIRYLGLVNASDDAVLVVHGGGNVRLHLSAMDRTPAASGSSVEDVIIETYRDTLKRNDDGLCRARGAPVETDGSCLSCRADIGVKCRRQDDLL